MIPRLILAVLLLSIPASQTADQGIIWRREAEQRAEMEQRVFLGRMLKFVNLWNEFAEEYSRGIVDTKKTTQLSRLFHQIEECPTWKMGSQ